MKKEEGAILVEKAYDNLNACSNTALFNMRHMIDLILAVRKVPVKEIQKSAKQFMNDVAKNSGLRKKIMGRTKKK